MRRFEQRLEEEVQQEIVAPDVDDVRDGGPDASDVREVLIRPHTNVRAALHPARDQLRYDVEVTTFVRNEVVGVEHPFRLGEPFDFFGETDASGRFEPGNGGQG